MKTTLLRSEMKQMMKVLTVAFFLAAAQDAQAGTRDAGGGNAVVCRDSKGFQSVRFLDYEISRYKNEFNLGLPGTGYREKVEFLLNRLGQRDAYLAADLKKLTEEFYQNFHLHETAEIRPLPYEDSKHRLIPTCENGQPSEIFQLAVQIDDPLPGEEIYVLNGSLWKAMDENSKAGLVLHEVLYRKARKNGATDSQAVQHFNAMIATEARIAQLSDQSFIALMMRTSLAQKVWSSGYAWSVTVGGIRVIVSRDVTFFENGNVSRAQAVPNADAWIQGQKIYIAENAWINFHDNRQVASFPPCCDGYQRIYMFPEIHGIRQKLGVRNSGNFRFNREGLLIQGSLFTEPLKVDQVRFDELYLDDQARFIVAGLMILDYHGSWISTDDPKFPKIIYSTPGIPSSYCDKSGKVLMEGPKPGKTWLTRDLKMRLRQTSARDPFLRKLLQGEIKFCDSENAVNEQSERR